MLLSFKIPTKRLYLMDINAVTRKRRIGWLCPEALCVRRLLVVALQTRQRFSTLIANWEPLPYLYVDLNRPLIAQLALEFRTSYPCEQAAVAGRRPYA